MKFKNKNKFKKWLKDVSKYKVDEKYLYYTLEEVEAQLMNGKILIDSQMCNNTITFYELSRCETKSGNPENYVYELIKQNEEFIIIF